MSGFVGTSTTFTTSPIDFGISFLIFHVVLVRTDRQTYDHLALPRASPPAAVTRPHKNAVIVDYDLLPWKVIHTLSDQKISHICQNYNFLPTDPTKKT